MSKIILPEEKPMFKWPFRRRSSEILYWIHENNRKVFWLDRDVDNLKQENQHQYKNLLDEIAELKFLLACMYASVVGLLVLTAILLLTR